MMENDAPAQDMLDKVRKLLAKAASVAGTPEAEALNAKAFELIAKYGIDEAQARQQSGQEPAQIERAEFQIAGQYVAQQRALLNRLALALHCAPVRDRRDGQETMAVYGVPAHTARVRVLFASLMPQMLAGAARVPIRGSSAAQTRQVRKSWMYGFYCEISARLTGAETRAAEISAPGTALVLVDDAQRADAAMRAEIGKVVKRRSQARYYATHAEMGAAAAKRVDLGQTGLGSRRALGR
ncbi:DUF2786 domain-containing protein [Nocardia sp. 2]|uniref:DUF2786 domain-containing protein n=1 Tax=Nocardia acididurans TaxID=2802282 RepID=A0ABS1MKS6_9NOCA|nr:DUF2786 domain-containing protein [Nocardia acididurans]MBL1080259.1 DUF2786 domain-containing protein [Nocardia acididurans]